MPFCYAEAAANILTNSALDPESKIPEYKYAAVKIERAGPGDGSGNSRSSLPLPGVNSTVNAPGDPQGERKSKNHQLEEQDMSEDFAEIAERPLAWSCPPNCWT